MSSNLTATIAAYVDPVAFTHALSRLPNRTAARLYAFVVLQAPTTSRVASDFPGKPDLVASIGSGPLVDQLFAVTTLSPTSSGGAVVADSSNNIPLQPADIGTWSGLLALLFLRRRRCNDPS